MSLRTAAGRTGLSASHLSRVERGLASLSLAALDRLSGVLAVDLRWLVRELRRAGECDDR